MFKSDPRSSLRIIGAIFGVHHTTVWHFLPLNLKLFSFCLHLGKQFSKMTKRIIPRLLIYASESWRRTKITWKTLCFIQCYNECNFSLHGAVNMQNCRIEGSERSETIYKTLKSSLAFMVWCTRCEAHIIGSYFFEEGIVTGERYKRMLRYFLFPTLADYHSGISFKQDGAPSH